MFAVSELTQIFVRYQKKFHHSSSVIMSQQSITTCLKFSLVAAFLLILQPDFAQPKKATGPSMFPDLESAIEPRRKDLGGELMVFIANRDTVIYQKAFGDINNR